MTRPLYYGRSGAMHSQALRQEVLCQQAVRKLPLMQSMTIFYGIYPIQRELSPSHSCFVYELSLQDDISKWPESIGSPGISMINVIYLVTDSDSRIIYQSDKENAFLEQKIKLLNALKRLVSYAYKNRNSKGELFCVEIFEHSGLYAYIQALEENAADDEYVHTMETLNTALSYLIKRIGIQADGSSNNDQGYANQIKLHQAFKEELSQLDLTSSFELFQKLSKALLMVSLVLATGTLYGLAPVGLVALSTLGSIGFFSFAKMDNGYRCAQAMLNASSQLAASKQ